jgi:hypothetical protein
VSDTSQGPGWWQASDLKWYPPQAVPAGTPPPSAPYMPGPYGAPTGPGSQGTNGLAVASLVLSLVWIWGLGSLLAIIFSVIAKRQMRQSHGTQSGDGLAVAGLIIGIVGLAGSILVTILLVAASTTLNNTLANSSRSIITSQCQADAKTMATALETYKAETDTDPPAGDGSQLLTTTSVGNQSVGPFLRALPSTTYYTIWTDGKGGVYVYPPSQTTVPTSFSSANDFFTGTPCNSVISVP